jgi:predicted amidohydrolase
MISHVHTDTSDGSVTIACLQMQPSFGDVAANVERSLQLINRAAADGANLVVLPELCNTGYVFASREEAPRKFLMVRRSRHGPNAPRATACISSPAFASGPETISSTAPS